MTTTPSPVFALAAIGVAALLSAGTATAAEVAAAIPAIKRVPAGEAAGVCPDSPLRLTYSGPVKLGTSGKIQIVDVATKAVVDEVELGTAQQKTIGGQANFYYYPVFITGNEVTYFPRNLALAYGHTYSVVIDPGVLTDNAGGALGVGGDPAGWRFTTKAAPPAAGTNRVTVAADGSGDFCTVQAAVDWIPDGNTAPTTIFIRAGVYFEIVYFTGKNALTFLGEDRKKTIIAYPNNATFSAGGGRSRGLFQAARCTDLTITNLTLWNTTPQGGSQAEAIILNGGANAHAIITGVDLRSFQDTMWLNGQTYISDCNVTGDVDFMWGNGPCYFENCTCTSVRSNAYFAQVRNPAANHGFVYHRCVFTGTAGVTGDMINRIAPNTYPASEVVLVDCTLGPAVAAVGWKLDGDRNAPDAPLNTASLHFWESNSRDPAGQPIDASHRLAQSRQLKQLAAAETIAHYADPTWVLGGNWDPKRAAIFISQPR